MQSQCTPIPSDKTDSSYGKCSRRWGDGGARRGGGGGGGGVSIYVTIFFYGQRETHLMVDAAEIRAYLQGI